MYRGIAKERRPPEGLEGLLEDTGRVSLDLPALCSLARRGTSCQTGPSQALSSISFCDKQGLFDHRNLLTNGNALNHCDPQDPPCSADKATVASRVLWVAEPSESCKASYSRQDPVCPAGSSLSKKAIVASTFILFYSKTLQRRF